MTEAGGSYETLAYFYQTTRRHIPEDGSLHSHSEFMFAVDPGRLNTAQTKA
jgi:hypothetical protein